MAGPLDRLLADEDLRSAVAALGDDLSGADLRSILLEVATRRAAARSPKQIVDQYRSDRFCEPAQVDPVVLAEVTASLLRDLSGSFEPIGLAPLTPLGTSSVVGPVPQNNVVTTMRLHDVGSDPTNALTLEAALRRSRPSDRQEPVRLCGVQRVVRAQRFDGPISFAHFSLLGLISAGRDRGDRAFETDELVRQTKAMSEAIEALDPRLEPRVLVSDFSGRPDEAQRIVNQLSPHLPAALRLERTRGDGYYQHLTVDLRVGDGQGEEFEVGDGGSTTWTQTLLADRKERLVISGLGIDRIVVALTQLDERQKLHGYSGGSST